MNTMNNLDWNEFCELYFETAKNYAIINLNRMKKKQGPLDRLVDEDYVIDCAVLAALEKTYRYYDQARGTKITTYLSTIVHNELVDTLKKESKAAMAKSELNDVKAYIRTLEYEDSFSGLSDEAKARLIPLLTAAVERLSASDQVILNYYLEDKSTYIDKSIEVLHVRRNYVSLRIFRIMKLLPKLMGLTRDDYLRISLSNENMVLEQDLVFSKNAQISHEEPTRKKLQSRRAAPSISYTHRRNPILPSLNIQSIAEMLLG